ncbi:MAG: hypothetical protein QXT91_00750 [Candidatus Caldarchaeum sp.]
MVKVNLASNEQLFPIEGKGMREATLQDDLFRRKEPARKPRELEMNPSTNEGEPDIIW